MLANKQTNKPESTESKKDIEAKHTENENCHEPELVRGAHQGGQPRAAGLANAGVLHAGDDDFLT